MQIRNPVLLLVLVIIGIGMVNSLFKDDPVPRDPQEVAKEEAERLAFNREQCRKSGLYYAKQWDNPKGECVSAQQVLEVSKENERKIQELAQEKANKGLK